MSVSFGTPVASNMVNPQTGYGIALTSVTSGQPVLVFNYTWHATGITSITDNFTSSYTYTLIDSQSFGAVLAEVWIGTGGSGTSGTITTHQPSDNCGGVAVSCVGASTASGLSAVESHSHNTATSTTATCALTPVAAGGGIIACSAGTANPTDPTAPWTGSTDITTGGTRTAGIVLYANAPQSLQTATWTGPSSQWGSVGAVIKAATAGTPPVSGSLPALPASFIAQLLKGR